MVDGYGTDNTSGFMHQKPKIYGQLRDENMIIWLIKAEENLPIEEGNVLGRVGSLAEYLSYHGNTVVWWTSTFRHPNKTYLFDRYTEVDVSNHYKLCLLHSRISYKKNVSVRRIRYFRILARQLKRKIKTMDKPDLIFSAWPAEPLCRVAIEYGKEQHVPVIVDARDMWPDIFERAFPLRLQGMANQILGPMKRKARYVFQHADALCAMSPVMLDWALNYAGREKKDLDRVIFIGNTQTEFSEDEWTAAIQQWQEIGISDTTWNICLFTSLSKTSLDIDTVIDATKLVHQSYPQIRFIIGGKGDDEQRLIELTSNLDFIFMMGWMNQIQMSTLMSISKVGMFCYHNTPDLINGWGNKIGQYLSYGLPILTSTTGYAKTYFAQFGCGLAYEEGNAQNLADVLIRLIEHPEERGEMSKRASERFLADFDRDVVSRQFDEMFNDVCKEFYTSQESKLLDENV